MGKWGYKLFPSLAAERDRLLGINADLIAKLTSLGMKAADYFEEATTLKDENQKLKAELARETAEEKG